MFLFRLVQLLIILKQMTFLSTKHSTQGCTIFLKPGEKCHTLVITIDIHLIVVLQPLKLKKNEREAHTHTHTLFSPSFTLKLSLYHTHTNAHRRANKYNKKQNACIPLKGWFQSCVPRSCVSVRVRVSVDVCPRECACVSAHCSNQA